LSVLLPFRDSAYPFDIFKLFLMTSPLRNCFIKIKYHYMMCICRYMMYTRHYMVRKISVILYPQMS